MIKQLIYVNEKDKNFIGKKAYNCAVMLQNGICGADGFVVYGKISKNDSEKICKLTKDDILYAVRSSMGNEDGENISSAGKYLSVLGVKKEDIVESAKKIFRQAGQNKFKAALVQEMIEPEVAGVIFTQNPISDRKTMLINAGLGIGENVVSGIIVPDEFEVTVNPFKVESQNILFKSSVYTYCENYEPGMETVYNSHRLRTVISNDNKALFSVHFEDRKKAVLNDMQLQKLAEIAQSVKELFMSEQDIEFAYKNGRIYILQSRPITKILDIAGTSCDAGIKNVKNDNAIQGQRVSSGTFCGNIIKIEDEHSRFNIKNKSEKYVLVMNEMLPELMYSFENIGAIVTSKGGILSHAAIVAREKAIPCVVGIEEKFCELPSDGLLYVDADNGWVKLIDEREDIL